MSLRDATWKRLLNETVFAVHCEVRRGDQLAATGSGWVWMKNPGNNELGSAGLRGMRLEWRIPIPKYEEVSSDNTWSVRFMSDWEQALLCTVSESYWDGDVTCPTVRFAKWTRQGGGEIQPVDHHPWAYAPDAKQPGKPKK